MLSASAFGSADNTYLDLDHSGHHKTSSNNCLFIVFRNARSRLYLSDHKTQTCARFDPKCWYNVRKRDKDNLPYVFSGVLCVFVTFSVKNIWWVVFIHFSYIITAFGMKRCEILFFMRHFYQSFESSRELALRHPRSRFCLVTQRSFPGEEGGEERCVTRHVTCVSLAGVFVSSCNAPPREKREGRSAAWLDTWLASPSQAFLSRHATLLPGRRGRGGALRD